MEVRLCFYVLKASAQVRLSSHFLDTNGLPLMKKRQGLSSPALIPIRLVDSIRKGSSLSFSAMNNPLTVVRSWPFKAVVTAKASVSFAGPLVRSLILSEPRFFLMASIPLTGWAARINTAPACPIGSVVTLRQ